MTKKEHYMEIIAILEAIKIEYVVNGDAEDDILKIIDKGIKHYQYKEKIDKDPEPMDPDEYLKREVDT